MSRVASFVLALALLGAVAPVAMPVAHAQAAPAPIPASGIAQFLPVGELPGDGKTASTLVVVAIRPDGQPWTGVKGKIDADVGAVSALREVSPGVYTASYTAPAVTARGGVGFTFSGRALDKSRLSASLSATVVPGLPRSAKVSADPKELVAGAGKSTELTLLLLDAAGRPADGADLVVRTSAGTVPSVNRVDAGRYVARYNAQPVNYPHLGIITFADARNPALNGHFVVPMFGSVDYPVTAGPGAQVTLSIGGTSYGPSTATTDGKARVPIVVPPGHKTASATIVDAGNVKVEDLDLRLPDTSRLLLYPVPESIPATGAAFPIRVFVATGDGNPDSVTVPTLTATAGAIAVPVHEGGGVWRADFTPAAPGPVTLTAAIAGAGDKQTDTLTFQVVAAPPKTVTVAAEPRALPKDGTSLAILAELRDAAGAPVATPSVSVTGGGATQKGDPEVVGPGKVKVSFETRKTGPVEILVTPAVPGTHGAVDRVVVLPARPRVPNDGGSLTPVVVVALDAQGLPVADVPVSLALSGVDGSVADTLTTGPNGVAVALFTPGVQPGLAQLRATAGDRTGTAVILQVPPTVAAVELPLAGSPGDIAATTAWAGLVQVIRVNRATEDASLWGVGVAEAEPEPEPAATAEPVVAPEPALAAAPEPVVAPDPVIPAPITPPPVVAPAQGGGSWLRARAGYVASTYRYLQQPVGSGGALMSQALAVGGEFGDSPAVPMGFEVHARAFLPGVFGPGEARQYLGFEGNYRSAFYGITADAFDGQVAPDTLTDVDVLALGRLPFEVGGGLVWVGARAGFEMSDFVYFTGSADSGQVRYETLFVPGMAVGGEVGAHFGRVDVVAGGTEVLAYGTNPWSTGLDVHVGVDLVDHVFFDIGTEYQVRKLELVSAERTDDAGDPVEYGVLSDGHLLFVSSLGVSF